MSIISLSCDISSEKLSEAKWRLSTFGIVAVDGSEASVGGSEHVPVSSKAYRHVQRKKSELRKVKMAVRDFYLSLAFLQRYQVDRYTVVSVESFFGHKRFSH